jgi:hypothetical protein
VARTPTVTLAGEVEIDEVYVVAGVVQNLPFSGYTGVRKAPACEGRIATGRVSCAGGCAPPRGQACWG